MRTLTVWLRALVDSYLFILLAALAAGLFFASTTTALAPWSAWFLGGIFFLSALKIDLAEVRRYAEQYRLVAVMSCVMLVVFPVVVYAVTHALAPTLAVAFLILAAMPSGMTSPLLTEMVGGNQSLALVLTVVTSLLAPVTVPLVITLLAGTAVAVSFTAMFLTLAKVIFIPFALAQIARALAPGLIRANVLTFKPISIALLGLLIAGIVAKNSAMIMSGLRGEFLWSLLGLTGLFVAFHIASYLLALRYPRAERLAITVCLSYMNFTLAIYLVGQYFTDPNIVVPVILSVLPWSLLLVPFQYMAKGLRG